MKCSQNRAHLITFGGNRSGIAVEVTHELCLPRWIGPRCWNDTRVQAEWTWWTKTWSLKMRLGWPFSDPKFNTVVYSIKYRNRCLLVSSPPLPKHPTQSVTVAILTQITLTPCSETVLSPPLPTRCYLNAETRTGGLSQSVPVFPPLPDSPWVMIPLYWSLTRLCAALPRDLWKRVHLDTGPTSRPCQRPRWNRTLPGPHLPCLPCRSVSIKTVSGFRNEPHPTAKIFKKQKVTASPWVSMSSHYERAVRDEPVW